MEAFRTLYEMTLYDDFASSFATILSCDEESKIKLPTMLLKDILQKASNPRCFGGIDFHSALAGKVLAQHVHSNTSITFHRCAFQPPAEEAFVNGILSKTDQNSALTGLCFASTLPFRSDESLVRLMMNGNGPIGLSYLFPDSAFSEEVLDCLCNSPGLQSLELWGENFTSNGAYASFINSLKSTSLLRSLTIGGWHFRQHDVAFPVEIFQNLSLTHFTLKDVAFHEAGWRKLLQEIPKCTTLTSLEFKDIDWWGSRHDEKLAEVEFALKVAQFLKDNPNILATTTKYYFGDDCDDDDGDDEGILYTTHLAPVLEHNHLLKNLKTLKRENYEVRGFLVSEAIGTRFATKVSSSYTMLKANVDVLVSFLSSYNEAKEG